LLLALALGATSAVSQAQPAAPPASEDEKHEAERHFQHGLSLARDRSWDAALAEFTASRERYPTRAATRNAAIALAQLRRFAESYEMYEALVHDFAENSPREQVDSWRGEMAALVAQTAEIVIAPTQLEVSVLVDGRRRGSTPLARPIRVNVGTHTVRFEKLGFEPTESVDTIAGGQRKLLSPRLRRLTDVGVLVVREASGGRLTVLVDGAPAGTTPWTGRVAPGSHHVELRGEGSLGTQPSSATVRGAATTTLVLKAATLDARLRVEPVPSNAVVYIDGVAVGAGVWSGSLPSGPHRIEVAASGHYTFRRQLDLAANRQRSLAAPLERDTSSPVWRTHEHRDLSLRLEAGALLAASLGGDAHADAAPLPRGLGATARLGYGVTRGLSLELSARFLSLWQPLTREVERREELYTWRSDDYEDNTRLLGGGLALGVAYRAFAKYPVTTRVAFGVAGLGSKSSVDATFHTAGIERRTSFTEQSELMLVPFGEAEVRVGYRLNERWSVDFGLGLTVFLPPRRVRASADSPDGVDRPRQIGVAPDANVGRLGRITLAEEVLTRSFSALSPTLGVRCEL
jgi:hypothetical protein